MKLARPIRCIIIRKVSLMQVWVVGFLCFLFLSVSSVDSVLGSDINKYIRVSLIEGKQGSQFTLDKRIKSLEGPLRDILKQQKELAAIKEFKPIKIFDPKPFEFGKKLVLPLDPKKGETIEISLQPLQDNYYPTNIRWYVKEGNKETDIIEVKNHKFNKDKSALLIGHFEKNASTTPFIAIEFVSPPK